MSIITFNLKMWVSKKEFRHDKTNYRLVSTLPNLSKLFDNILHKKISESFENIFTKYQVGFQIWFSAQNCLISKNLYWPRRPIRNFTHRSPKGFWLSLSHDLLIAKPSANDFNTSSLKLIHNYLTNRYERVGMNDSYSVFNLIKCSIPQRFLLGPILFSIFLYGAF